MNKNKMSEFLKQTVSFSKKDKLFFHEILKNFDIDEKIIILSPLTANWLVIDRNHTAILDDLIQGKEIGIVAASAEATGNIHIFKKLITQIIAKNFASTTQAPQPLTDNSLKGAYFYLTNACNLSCSHCYMFSGKADSSELTIDEWIIAVNNFAESGGTNITFSGGEILAKRGWFQVVKQAHNRGIKSTLLTNGTMWDSKSISDVAPYVSEVQISLDGPTEEINAKTRGSGAYKIAIDTAKEFSAKGVRTSIAMTATLETIHLFESDFQIFFENQIVGTGINIKISHKLLSGRSVNALTGLNKKIYEEKASRLSEIIYPKSKQRSFALEHKPNILHKNCGFGGASISSTGDVYPCNRIDDVRSLGNIKTDNFEKLIALLNESSKMTDVDSILPCKHCDLRYVCGGGCRIDDYYLLDSKGANSAFNNAELEQNTVKKDFCPDSYKTGLLRQMMSLNDYKFIIE